MPTLNDLPLDNLISMVVILVGAVVAALLLSRLLSTYVRRFAVNSQSRLDDAVLKALRGPMIYTVLLVGLWFALQRASFLIEPDNSVLATIFFLAYVALTYVALYRLVIELTGWYESDVAEHTATEVDEQILPLIRRIILIVLSGVAVVALLGHFDVDVSAFVATLGVTSLAVALAAQAVLEDMISGIIINIDRPFRIGDRIELEELNTWGDVQDIGIRSTRILTRDHRLVSVPNSLIGRNRIVNHSIPSTQYRVQTHVSIAYDCDIDQVRKILIEAVAAQEWVMKDKRIEALFLEFQDSGLYFRVRCWIDHYVETRRIIDKLNTVIYKALTEEGVEIPFPQRVVHIQYTPPTNGISARKNS